VHYEIVGLNLAQLTENALPIAPRQQCRESLPSLGLGDPWTTDEGRPAAGEHGLLVRTQ
jgi:hypothetical protein